MTKTSRSGRGFEDYTRVNRTFGPLARIGPNDLITDDPELLRRMSSARSPYGKSDWYRGVRIDPHNDAMGSTMDARAHDKLKAKTASAYSGKENPDLEAGIDGQLVSMIRYIRQRYLSINGELRPLDLARMAQFFTLDVIGRLAYGREFGHLYTDSDVFGYIRTMTNGVGIVQLRADVPLISKALMNPQVLKVIGPKATDKEGMGKLMA